MEYSKVIPATFASRPNRFIAHCEVDGRPVVAHTRNTGRMRELLIPGAAVFLEPAADPGRKTSYTLVSVYKGRELVNIDSQAPNRVVHEALEEGLLLPGMGPMTDIRREVRMGDSRFDIGFMTGGLRGFLEVKGVTLEVDGRARFPDAPTERGVKHVRELIQLRGEGYATAVFFLVQMKGVYSFSPNDTTHPAFGDALRDAQTAGVPIYCYDARVEPGGVVLGTPVPVRL